MRFPFRRVMFHIRAKPLDLCFELVSQIMARIGGAVSPRTKCMASVILTTAI